MQQETPEAHSSHQREGEGPSAQAGLKGVYVSTYGCQMNVNDSERMLALLENDNFTPVQSPEMADLILINSCSVREKPVHKVYSEVGTYRKLKEKNPNLRIGVGGCVGQQEKDNLLKNAPLIDFVFGTDSIDLVPELAARSLGAQKGRDRFVETRFRHRDPFTDTTLIRRPGVSTFVNITKGCDNFCSFCIVPFTRGREKSRSLRAIVEDVQGLEKRGAREVTLLGQNVNSYRSECGAGLAELLQALVAETGVWRIRFTTSHPKDFDQKLAETMARLYPRVCEYVHLPAQSGSSRILEAMNRGYTREEYLARIAMIKASIPNACFSTDLIVGFPGETEDDFLDTVSLLEEVGHETIFAFKYSPRPFTKAARLEDQVPEEVKDERLARLFAAHDKISAPLVARLEGQILEVLVEGKDTTRGNLHGKSSHNKNVYFLGPDELVGTLAKVRILRAQPAVLRGEWVEA